MRWTAVVNPTAGRGRASRLLPRLAEAAADLGVAVHVAASPADGQRIARDALHAGRGIVACGGDGTVAELAGVVAEAGGVLGVVPVGSGNDFARQLGIDHHRPLDALALLHSGTQVACDLGRAEAADGPRRWFATVAHTGFDAEANRWANGVTFATGTALYVLAVLRTLGAYRPEPVRVVVDGVAWEGPAWLVAVANGRYYAGGMMIAPDAAVDDGLLDVCIIGDIGIAEFLVRFPSVFRGAHVDVDEVAMLRGACVEVDAPSSRLPLELWASGERVGRLPARIEAVPGAVRVMAPARPAGHA